MTHIEAPFAWGLTRGMARVLGINLVDAVSEGWFSRSDLAEMVDTCETCGEVRRCTAYLATAPRAESRDFGFLHHRPLRRRNSSDNRRGPCKCRPAPD